MKSYKQVILVRQDLKLPNGKLAVQVAHAAVEAFVKSDRSVVDKWRFSGQKKVVLKVKDLAELEDYEKKFKKAGIKAVKISDAGRTVLAPGTVTCIGVGPEDEEKIDAVSGELKIL